jgi:hypothetical protein
MRNAGRALKNGTQCANYSFPRIGIKHRLGKFSYISEDHMDVNSLRFQNSKPLPHNSAGSFEPQLPSRSPGDLAERISTDPGLQPPPRFTDEIQTSNRDLLERASTETAEQLHKAAASIRDQSAILPEGAISERIASGAANALDKTGSYLANVSIQTLQDSLGAQVRKNPWLTVGIGFCLGLWMGRTLRR